MPEHRTPFHELFREHLEQGTRADRSPDDPGRIRWKILDFANTAGVDIKTVGNWKAGRRTPESDHFEEICRLLFGANPLHAAAKAAFIAAWHTANANKAEPGRKPATSLASHDPQSAPSADSGTQAPRTWRPQAPYVRARAGKIWVHRQQGNDGLAATVPLEVTVDVGAIYVRVEATADTPEVAMDFAVTNVELSEVETLNMTPVKGSELGGRERPHADVTFSKFWKLKVPLAADGQPSGVVLASETLRQYTVTSGQSYGVRLELRCRGKDLQPTQKLRLAKGADKREVTDKVRAMICQKLRLSQSDADDGSILLAAEEISGPEQGQ